MWRAGPDQAGRAEEAQGEHGQVDRGGGQRERHYNVRPRRRQETANIAKFYAFKNDSSSADSEEEEDEIRDIHKQKQEVGTH